MCLCLFECLCLSVVLCLFVYLYMVVSLCQFMYFYLLVLVVNFSESVFQSSKNIAKLSISPSQDGLS